MSKVIRVGLNGFGRIGRAFTRIALSSSGIEIKAINTSRSSPEILSHLLQYDSVYRTFEKNVSHRANHILIEDTSITCFNYQNPQDIPWDTQDVDIVIDCTGVFKTRQELSKHLTGSVAKVILTSPTKDKTIPHIVLGVNDDTFPFKEADIISNASCTTNCAAVMFKIIHDEFGVASGFLTTIHAYTSSQQLLDGATSDLMRSRAAGLSIVPSTTGAASSIGKVLPDLEGKLNGTSIRVPTPVGSYTDISCIVTSKATISDINIAFQKASNDPKYKNILSYQETPLVSSDYIGNNNSCVFDANYTAVLPQSLIKVFGWYDNEWGYSSRLVDLTQKLREHL